MKKGIKIYDRLNCAMLTRAVVLCAMALVGILSCKPAEMADPIHTIIYTQEFHDEHPELYRADSLHFMGAYKSAFESYKSVLNNNALDETIRAYIYSNLALLDTDVDTALVSYEAASGLDYYHPQICLRLARYAINYRIRFNYKSCLQEILQEEKRPYILGNASYLLAMYYETYGFELDSAWYYMIAAKDAFQQMDRITKVQQEVFEALTRYCIYKRKNLLGIRFANALFDFEKYIPEAGPVERANAHATRAFLLFRVGDMEGTKEDIESGLKWIDPEEYPDIYQNLLKTYLVIYMIQGHDSLWWDTADKLDANIRQCGSDYIDLYRWKGQYLAWKGEHRQAIPYLLESLKQETGDTTLFTAKLSTLCTELSVCYEHLYRFDKALDYVAYNQYLKPLFDENAFFQSVTNSHQYSYYSALRYAQIKYAHYLHTGEINLLHQARKALELIDRLIFRQFNVVQEDAILQFYLESGNLYIKLDLDVYFALWKAEGDPVYLEAFVHYSEKSKNSIMQRDFLMVNHHTELSPDLIEEEIKLRSAIKEQQNKGLRDNKTFDQLMDDYEQLEVLIKKNFATFLTESLKREQEPLSRIQAKLPNSETCILLIDETSTRWYFTLINRDTVIVKSQEMNEQNEIVTDSMRSILQRSPVGQQTLKAYLSKNSHLMIPTEIISRISERIYLIPDGIYQSLPFHLLLPGEYHEVLYAPAAGWLQKAAAVDGSAGEKVFFSFSDKKTIKSNVPSGLPELPGTYLEVKALQQKFPEAKVYTGYRATKSNFLKAYTDPQVSYIHLALHGTANSSLKDDVKLYFRHPNGGLDSLLGYELLRYKSNCKKIVLSACQSGNGVYAKGEGIYSLPRYFMINGALEVESSWYDLEDLDYHQLVLTTSILQ